MFQKLSWDVSQSLHRSRPARQSVSSGLQKAANLFLMGLSLLVRQCIWQLRTRLTEADVLMREEQGRSEDCLPTRRQTILPADELAPGQRPRDENERPRRCLQSQMGSEVSLVPHWRRGWRAATWGRAPSAGQKLPSGPSWEGGLVASSPGACWELHYQI